MRRPATVLYLLFFCALLIGGAVGGSVSAQAYETPHGPYGAFPVGCAACHVAHASLGPQLLMKSDITTLCLTCHDGTASVFNVVYVPEVDIYGTGVTREVYGYGFGTTSGAVYFHPVKNTGNPAVGEIIECTHCHNPHGDMSVPDQVYPRLLKSTDGTNSYYKGPDFCLACHGAVDHNFTGPDDTYWEDTLGNHENTNAAHYDTAKAALQPASGTYVTCATCHFKHASDQSRLLAKAEENLCFKCHDNPANSMSGRNIQAEFSVTRASYHDIYGERTGAKVECSSCHGPHTVGAKSLSVSDTTYSQVANPDNTKSVMARVYAVQDNGIGNTVGTFTDFCIKCHDGDPPTATESTTEYVPYTIVFPSTSFTTNSGGWNKSAYTGKGHDSASTPILCSDCHESHGSDYPALQRYAEDTATADGECLRCHKSGGYTGAADVKTDLTKTYRHPTLYISGKHSNTENYNNLPLADRHAECADCHDPHRCDSTTASAPAAWGSIKGVSGALINYGSVTWDNWPTGVTSSLKLGIDYQYELCFKCHSCFSYGSSPPSGYTDQAKEFNPNNPGYHAVWGASKIGSAYGKFTGVDRNGNAWAYNSRMYCTDCHGSDSTSVEGPHGSSQQYILKAPWNPDTSQAGATGKRGTDTSSHLCFKCHDYAFYAGSGGTGTSKFSGTKGSNLHVLTKMGSYVHQQGCACCHGAVPHGYFRRGILVTYNDGSPYTTGVRISSITVPSSPGQWNSKWNCYTQGYSSCH